MWEHVWMFAVVFRHCMYKKLFWHPTFIGSLSPVRGSFDARIDDEYRTTQVEAIWTALTDAGSSSKRGPGQSFGWTSSEDELEAMEQDDDGMILLFEQRSFLFNILLWPLLSTTVSASPSWEFWFYWLVLWSK